MTPSSLQPPPDEAAQVWEALRPVLARRRQRRRRRRLALGATTVLVFTALVLSRTIPERSGPNQPSAHLQSQAADLPSPPSAPSRPLPVSSPLHAIVLVLDGNEARFEELDAAALVAEGLDLDLTLEPIIAFPHPLDTERGL